MKILQIHKLIVGYKYTERSRNEVSFPHKHEWHHRRSGWRFSEFLPSSMGLWETADAFWESRLTWLTALQSHALRMWSPFVILMHVGRLLTFHTKSLVLLRPSPADRGGEAAVRTGWTHGGSDDRPLQAHVGGANDPQRKKILMF